MIQEDYVSYEVAKLLKEKGFDAMCEHYDFEDWQGLHSLHNAYGNWNAEKGCTSIPSSSLAMKWLREKHKLFIDVSFQKDEDGSVTWFYMIWALDYNGREYGKVDFSTFEEAVEAALKYALENLI